MMLDTEKRKFQFLSKLAWQIRNKQQRYLIVWDLTFQLQLISLSRKALLKAGCHLRSKIHFIVKSIKQSLSGVSKRWLIIRTSIPIIF